MGSKLTSSFLEVGSLWCDRALSYVKTRKSCVTTKGVPPTTYPVLVVSCPGDREGVPMSWLGGGGWSIPVLGLTGVSPATGLTGVHPSYRPDWGTPLHNNPDCGTPTHPKRWKGHGTRPGTRDWGKHPSPRLWAVKMIALHKIKEYCSNHNVPFNGENTSFAGNK